MRGRGYKISLALPVDSDWANGARCEIPCEQPQQQNCRRGQHREGRAETKELNLFGCTPA